MSDKRFTMCFEQNDINGWTMSIVDWETKEPFDYTTYEVHSSSITDTKDEMEDLCLLLNELNDENKKLKIFLKAVNEELDLANRDYDALEEENEKLKQFKENVLVLLEEKVKHYEHKPFSIPAMQPLSLNFDGDMDRISRLSELQDLKRVIEQGVEKGYKKRNGG